MNERLTTVIERGGKFFLVSTVYANVFPVGWETLVFPCEPDGRVTDWVDVAAKRHANAEQAKAGHAKMVASFEVH